MTVEGGSDSEWQKVVDGDRDTFSRLTAPLVPALREAAAQELDYFTGIGELPADVSSPEEIVGEALLRAWRHRHRRPAGVSLEAWLLKVVYRVVDELVHRERRRAALAEAVGNQHPELPPLEDDNEFWQWFQPEDLPIGEPMLPQPAPSPEEIAAKLGVRPQTLATPARRALWMHRRHRLTVREIGAVLRRPAAEVRTLVEQAAARVRESRPTRSGS